MNVPPARRPGVLLIDDDQSTRFFLRLAFEALHYRVQEAIGPEEGLRMVRQQAPDLIVLDFRMPGMDGLECARRVRESWAGPLVMLTAREDPELPQRAAAAGVDRFYSKPFDWLTLAKAASRLVRS